MFARKSRLKTIVCALMLLCAPALYAEDKNDAPTKEQVKGIIGNTLSSRDMTQSIPSIVNIPLTLMIFI